ncbi:MAG: hypothetical protein II649_09430 [Kiritimatiellae bacterium]|nr:hypothetical protein [Kiritimatiellia bacterium]
MAGRARKSREGQIALVLAFMLFGLVLLTIVGVDSFLAAHRKNRMQNAGDAGAIAAARWQGITLNALGAINLAKIEAVCQAGDAEAQVTAQDVCKRLSALQERIAFAGPLMGFFAAQRAAVANGIGAPDKGMGEIVDECIRRSSLLLATELWPQKAADYATMLRGAAADGVFCGADNAQYFDYTPEGGHILYNRGFYAAVEGRDWCWFYWRRMRDFPRNFSGWGSIPEPKPVSPDNPEFFGADIRIRNCALADLAPIWNEDELRGAVLDLASRNDCLGVTDFTLRRSGVLTNSLMSWAAYNDEWHEWNRMHRSDEARLPIVSDVKDKYDVQGAFAATRVRQVLEPLTPGVGARINTWTAAAKPFGSIDESTVTWDGCFALVSPAFTDVRLTMLAAFPDSRFGMADRDWLVHVREHVLPPSSVKHVAECPYCKILKEWEKPALRNVAVKWLDKNGDEQCRRSGGQHGDVGGTRIAH